MTLDNPNSNDIAVADSAHILPSASLPKLIEPDQMDKVLKYLLRHGLLVAILLDIIYQLLWMMHEYVRGGRIRPESDSPFTVTSRLRWLVPVKITLTVSSGKATLSIPLWPWLQKLTRRRAFDLGNLLADEIPGKTQLFFVSASVYAFFVGLPTYVLTGLFQSMSATIRATARAVPYLIGLLIIMFITGDAWRLFGDESLWRYSVLIVLVVVMSVLALLAALREWLSRHDWQRIVGYPTDESARILVKWRAKTPAISLLVDGAQPEFPLVSQASNPANRLWCSALAANVSILMFVIIIADVLAVAFWMSLAFCLTGFIAVNSSMTRALAGESPILIFHFTIFGQTFILTQQLVLLSIALGGIAALTFSAAALQDASSRRTFTAHAFVDLQRALSALACYKAVILGFLNGLEDTGILAKLRRTDNPSLKKILDGISVQESKAKT